MEHVKFSKIPRLFRNIVITEKIDGTNAQVTILEDGTVLAGSRTRWITPLDDNFGFALWVKKHEEELRALGVGTHYGEWWGTGIQRGYDLSEKRFSLFNTAKWSDGSLRPKCCRVVPVLYEGPFDTQAIRDTLDSLSVQGSAAEPGYMKPEGIVVFHTAGNLMFKATIDNDEGHKGDA